VLKLDRGFAAYCAEEVRLACDGSLSSMSRSCVWACFQPDYDCCYFEPQFSPVAAMLSFASRMALSRRSTTDYWSFSYF